ncbi:Protein FAR1-RELATED SEQUENCE 5, partial [Linum perenne]
MNNPESSKQAIDPKPTCFFDLNAMPNEPIDEEQSTDDPIIANSEAIPEITDGLDVPEVDFDWSELEFKTVKEAEEFYKDYAHSIGFESKTRSTSKNNSKGVTTDKVHYIYLTCNKEDYKANSLHDPKNQAASDSVVINVSNPTVPEISKPAEALVKKRETRCGCFAKMSLKLDEEKDVFKIYYWFFKHNHVLIPPRMRKFFRSKRKMSEAHREMAKMHDMVGIRPRDSYDLMATCGGGIGSLAFTRSDHANFVRAFRSSHVEEGGDKFLRQWFKKESSRDPGFYHEYQLDSDKNIESIFWADARMQRDYQCFGDSISFDTTYRTNNTFRPL